VALVTYAHVCAGRLVLRRELQRRAQRRRIRRGDQRRRIVARDDPQREVRRPDEVLFEPVDAFKGEFDRLLRAAGERHLIGR